MKRECPNPQPECKYFDTRGGCFADRHHIYGRPKTGIAKNFGRLAVNVEIICRRQHEDLHAEVGVLPLPDVDTMKRVIAENRV